MSKILKWEDNRIIITPHRKPKKITGTRFASILNMDPWNTEFKTWCDITKTYSDPFEDNIYTLAGKIIEPKIIQYLRDTYFRDSLVTPEDVYGSNPFQKTWGDFFPDDKVFGGMWDSLIKQDGETVAVVEIKTTKRVEDWEDKSPDYYALQASLYAYNLGVPQVYMVAAFLEDEDYENPENFIPSFSNVYIEEFDIYQRFPFFLNWIDFAEEWWKSKVEAGISPVFDEKKDADILRILRTTTVVPDYEEMRNTIKRAEELCLEIEKLEAPIKEIIKEKEKELKTLKDGIKNFLIESIEENCGESVLQGGDFVWSLKTNTKSEVDSKKLKEDGLLEKYSYDKLSFTLYQRRK